MAILAAALPVIGAVTTAASTVMSGIATSNAASYQAQIAENNAEVARNNATYALEAGGAKTQQAGLQAAEHAGEVKTALAANNVDVNTGSAVEVEAGTRAKGAYNEYAIANNADLTAYGYRTQADSFDASAQLDKATAEEAPIGAGLGAAGSLLSNSSALSSKWALGFGGGSALASNAWTLDTATAPG